MSSIKKLAGDTVIYGLSTIIGRFINYLLVPLHTTLFLPTALAPQVQLYVYAAIAYTLFPLGLETAFFRYAGNGIDRKECYNIILSAVLVMSLCCSIPIFIFSEQLAIFIQYPHSAFLVRLFAIIMILQGISVVPSAKLRLEGRGKRFAFIAIFNVFSIVFFNVFFLIFCRDISSGKYLNFAKPFIDLFYFPEFAANYIIISNVLSSILWIILLRKEFAGFHFVLRIRTLKVLLVYALPILLVNLAGVLNTFYDRVIMQFLLPANFYPGRTTRDAIGIYGVCSQLSGFMNMAIQAFKYAAEPFFFSTSEDQNAPEVFARVMKYFIIICSIMWVAVSINLDILAGVFIRQDIYHEGLVIVPWQLAGFFFLGIYYNLTIWFKLSDKTRFGAYFALIGVGVTLIASLILVPRFGYLGFAYAFTISGMMMMILCYVIGQRYYYIPYRLKSALFYITFAGLVIYFSQFIKIENLIISAAIHFGVLVMLILVIFFIERKELILLLRRKNQKSAEPSYVD